ncbi:SCP-like protein, partial [Ancylostoma duodenale]
FLPSLIAASTFCPNNTAMKDHQINKFLNAHNIRRQSLAMGLLVKRNGNRLPSAANMLKMQYNCALQEAAYTHARLCTNTNSGGRSNIGENIAQIGRGVASNKLQAIEKMAWSSTYRLGCGIAGCTGFYNIVCQYSPA